MREGSFLLLFSLLKLCSISKVRFSLDFLDLGFICENLVCNRRLLGSTTLWSVYFSLDFGVEDSCSVISILFFYLFSFINFYNFMFVLNMIFFLMIEIVA